MYLKYIVNRFLRHVTALPCVPVYENNALLIMITCNSGTASPVDSITTWASEVITQYLIRACLTHVEQSLFLFIIAYADLLTFPQSVIIQQ